MTREEANMWIENTFSDFTKEEDRQESIFYLVKKIFDDKEKKEEAESKEVCNHEKTIPYYEYVRCNECGAIKTDSDSSWGIAKNKWFKNKEEAYFYKEKGYLPTYENGISNEQRTICQKI